MVVGCPRAVRKTRESRNTGRSDGEIEPSIGPRATKHTEADVAVREAESGERKAPPQGGAVGTTTYDTGKNSDLLRNLELPRHLYACTGHSM